MSTGDWFDTPIAGERNEAERIASQRFFLSPTRPRIVVLIGSTKFKKEFEHATMREGWAGHIVLTVTCFTHADQLDTPADVLARVHELHFRKIDMADEVLVINPGGYIGEQTSKELQYAQAREKWVRFMVPMQPADRWQGATELHPRTKSA